MTHDPSRRDFIQRTLTASVALGAGLPGAARAADDAGAAGFPMSAPGRLVRIHDSRATEKVIKTNDDIVKAMVAEALTRLTGAKTPGDAMKRFVKASDLVGVKVNTLGSPYATVTPATAFAVAEAVHAAGVPKNNVIIYDQYGSRMTKAGFRPFPGWKKPAPDEFPVHSHKTLGYEEEWTDTEGRTRRGSPGKVHLAKLSRKLTAVINVCVPKDHDLTGITGALKNVAYGNVETVPTFHCDREKCNPVCKHDGRCNVARVYDHPELGRKVRLVVVDAVRVLYHGGPQDKRWREAHNEIWASTDPVAVDRTIHQVVDEYRKKNKMPPVAEDRDGRRAPRFIDAAATMGLGVADPAKITTERHSLG